MNAICLPWDARWWRCHAIYTPGVWQGHFFSRNTVARTPAKHEVFHVCFLLSLIDKMNTQLALCRCHERKHGRSEASQEETIKTQISTNVSQGCPEREKNEARRGSGLLRLFCWTSPLSPPLPMTPP